MPRRDLRRNFLPDSWYHVYNQTNAGVLLFPESRDYWTFRDLAAECIEKHHGNIRLAAFALLPNHFHLLLWQKNPEAIRALMHSLMICYRKHLLYRRNMRGQIFESTYKAILQIDEVQLERTSMYILRNPSAKNLTDWHHSGTLL